MEDRLQRLLDEADIRELLTAFGRALDERDWTAYGETFTEDGVFEIFGQRRVGRAEISDGPRRDMARFHHTQHLITGQTVTLAGDDARTQGYVLAVHVPDGAAPHRHADVGGIYHARCRRTGEGWRFSEMRFELSWLAGLPYLGDLPAEGAPAAAAAPSGGAS